MNVFNSLGTLPENNYERHLPFLAASEAGVLGAEIVVNDPITAAQMVINGTMPDRKGLVDLKTELAGYDFVGSFHLSDRGCVLPFIRTSAVDDRTRDFKDTGIITYTTEDGLLKLVGAVVDVHDTDRAREYGRVAKIGSGLAHVIFEFDKFPQFEIKEFGEEEIVAKVRTLNF